MDPLYKLWWSWNIVEHSWPQSWFSSSIIYFHELREIWEWENIGKNCFCTWKGDPAPAASATELKTQWLMKSYKWCDIFPRSVGFSRSSAALSGWFWVTSLNPVKARKERSALVSCSLPPIICQPLPKTPSRVAAASRCAAGDLLPQTLTDKLSSPASSISRETPPFHGLYSWVPEVSTDGWVFVVFPGEFGNL